MRAGLALVLMWFVAVAAVSLLGASAARAGADRVQDLDLSSGVRELLDGGVEDDLESALDDFQRADRFLNNPLTAPARVLPIVGRQLRSAGSLASASVDVLDVSSSAAQVLRQQVDEGAPTGAGRVDAIRRLGAEVRAVDGVLHDVDLGPSEALVSPLHDARQELSDKLLDARQRTEDLIVVLDLMEDLLDGPSRYLVLAANNAEMRVGSGMFLSMGELEFTDGTLRISHDFQPARDLVVDEPVAVPADVAALWGWSAIGSDYRSLGFSARFPVNASIARDQWSALGRGDVDGVLLVDVVALQAILEIVGPVQLQDRQVGPDDVVGFLLQDQYVEADDADGNQDRRERLGELAGRVLEEIDTAPTDLVDLLDGLRKARDGRHLMAWSATAAEQAAWTQLGVDGELDDTSVLVGLANVDGGKLDPYLDVSVESLSPSHSDGAYELSIRIRNTAPDGLNRYVEGSDASPDYRGLLSAHLPATARDVSLDGFDGLSAFGPDGATTVIAAPVTIEQGAQRVGTLRFTVPPGPPQTILPSARVPPVRWTFGGRTVADDSEAELPRHGR